MTNLQKYNKAFIDTLSIEEEKLNDLTYQSIDAWDSIGHMGLISAIEEEFGITMDIDDIIDLSSYKKGIEILNKYKITIN